MYLSKIELTNFRNYEKFKLENLQNINIIIGSNGIGKTSILESIYVCSLARSFKTSSEEFLINKNSNFYKIKILLKNEEKSKSLEYIFTDKGKKTKINNFLKKKLSDFISQYKVIVFSPDELKIIKESPNIRRNYLNVCLSQINKNYVRLLNKYNILLKNKNEYLKKSYINAYTDFEYLDLLDEKIVEVGKEICTLRCEYIEKINKYIKKIFKKFRKNDDLFIKYDSQFLNKNEKQLLSILKKNRKSEMELGFSKIGIHRDDFEFIHNDISSKEFSSQGLQKLILLSLKMSELEVLINDYYEQPILLLDDLFSELDAENQNNVIKNLNTNIQIFITTTDLNNIKASIVKKAKVIDLGGGKK